MGLTHRAVSDFFCRQVGSKAKAMKAVIPYTLNSAPALRLQVSVTVSPIRSIPTAISLMKVGDNDFSWALGTSFISFIVVIIVLVDFLMFSLSISNAHNRNDIRIFKTFNNRSDQGPTFPPCPFPLVPLF